MIFGDVKRAGQALMVSEMPIFCAISRFLTGVCAPGSAPVSAPPGNAARTGRASRPPGPRRRGRAAPPPRPDRAGQGGSGGA